MINAIIVDDEISAIKALNWELEKFKNDINITSTFTSPQAALNYVNTELVDCIFLDIHMQVMTGFEFMNKLKASNLIIIITSAFDQYGIKAIKEELVLDYLLKPIDSEDLNTCIQKIKKHFNKNLPNTQFEQFLLDFDKSDYQKKISLNTDGRIIFLEPDTIYHVESEGNYSTIFFEKNKKIVITKKLKEVEVILNAKNFYRVHNSFIINLNKIKEYIKSENYVILENMKKIPVSRQKKTGFLDHF